MLESRATRKEQRVGTADMKDAADAKRRHASRADCVGALMRDLAAQRQAARDRTRQCEAALPEVAIAGARIDRIAAAAEQRPRAEILLRPDRQEQLDSPGAEAAARAWQDRTREDCHRKARRLVIHKAIFDAKLHVANAGMDPSAAGEIDRQCRR